MPDRPPPAQQLLVGEIFRRNAQLDPDARAASLGDAEWRHGDLERAGERLAAALRELGVRHGDRVVSWSDTSLAVLPWFVALAKLGAVFAPLNARLGPDEAADVAGLARARLLVVDPVRADDASRVARRAGIPLVARQAGAHARGAGDGPGPALDPDALPDPPAPLAEPALDERDPHVLFFTSGSTGRPKGVVLSHRANFLRGFQGVFRDVPERTVCMFPLFHMAAFTLGLAAWQTRGEIVFVREASAEQILSAVERRRANRLYCIPLVWKRILESEPGRWDLSSLRECDTGTSATPPSLVEAIRRRFPEAVTRIYYGSTEIGLATALAHADLRERPGSVGRAAPGVDVRLSEEGEVLVRSAYMMDGYFDDPARTAETLRDGWYHSGDLGAFDADGYLTILGRKGELIRTGGESVAPREVEEALVDAPGVREVAVVGVPDLEYGELVCAVVVPGAQPPSLPGLRAHCADRLAGFKRPRRLALIDSLPRTAATGQVQRALLIERLQSGDLPSAG